MRLILIGCSKKKRPYQRDPKRGGRVLPTELYDGQLFHRRVRYAEQQGAPWAVLSAAFGMWPPDVERNPTYCGFDGKVYDFSLESLPKADQAAWHVDVAKRVIERLWEPYHVKDRSGALEPAEMSVEIHAGKAYAHPLAEILGMCGVQVVLPVTGLGIGQQLRWYDSQQREVAA